MLISRFRCQGLGGERAGVDGVRAVLRPRLAACAAVSGVLLLLGSNPTYAQPALEQDELIVHPEPKDPDFFRSRRDGWFWLNDPSVAKRQKKEAQDKAQKEAPIVPPPATSKSAELKAHADLARAVDEALKVAYINPTEENLKRYLELWQFTVRKASVFTDLAQQAMWKNPQYDATVADGVRPVNPLATAVYDEQRRDEQVAKLRELSREYGIWFFFDQACGVCRVYAPLLKSFQTTYGFSVLAISSDGSTLPQFANTRRDNGVGKELGVIDYPQTFLVNPKTRDVIHLGAGAMSAEQLAERAIQILKYKEIETRQRVAQLSVVQGR
ncbi:MAG TPA: conjugal transfer protein TraF [Burkholderiaceae bacterium]|nr:conjugal transfer protein TraF [Burkholderiaceae bacterium]